MVNLNKKLKKACKNSILINYNYNFKYNYMTYINENIEYPPLLLSTENEAEWAFLLS